jgi:transcriptional regulator with XRE-family HTH domain
LASFFAAELYTQCINQQVFLAATAGKTNHRLRLELFPDNITPDGGCIGRRYRAMQAMHEERALMAKKTPNPIDKHVGSRVRMRRMMLSMSQEKLGDALGLTFQQVQKYEKGTNRIGASRLQQISNILQVPVAFFFEGAPDITGGGRGQAGAKDAPSPAYISDFLSSSDGLALTKAFMRIPDPKLRRRIVDLVEQIAGDDAK